MMNNDTMGDEEIISYLQSGDTILQNKAFRFLYTQYYGLVESLLINNNGNIEEVADLFQDGLIVFFNQVKHKKFEGKSTIKTYLYSICRNLWLMKLRKGKKEVQLVDSHQNIPVEDSYFDTLVMGEKKHLIIQLLNQLNSECKKIIHLYYYRKMRIKEIKETLDLVSEQVVKNRKSRCMKSLRAKIMENEEYQISLR